MALDLLPYEVSDNTSEKYRGANKRARKNVRRLYEQLREDKSPTNMTGYLNGDGYADPTAYAAICDVLLEERRRTR